MKDEHLECCMKLRMLTSSPVAGCIMSMCSPSSSHSKSDEHNLLTNSDSGA